MHTSHYRNGLRREAGKRATQWETRCARAPSRADAFKGKLRRPRRTRTHSQAKKLHGSMVQRAGLIAELYFSFASDFTSCLKVSTVSDQD